MGYWNRFPRYVPVAERRAKALRQAEKFRKKSAGLEPVIVAGRTIASSWWGKSWNKNLERYADYSNRIGRGRSYVCNGMVLDLKIEKGTIQAIVAGSQRKPYQVSIRIKTLPSSTWRLLVENATGRIESMQGLLAGQFPEELKELFFSKDQGLFPKPAEISFDCSCPDWASMCKHVAATLFGVSARLDSTPELFFTLRGVSVNELVGQVAKQATEKLLTKEKVKSKRVMKTTGTGSEDIEVLFGISMATTGDTTAPPVKRRDAKNDKQSSGAVKKQPKSAAIKDKDKVKVLKPAAPVKRKNKRHLK
jgi:uncharacterized Zn finger protein